MSNTINLLKYICRSYISLLPKSLKMLFKKGKKSFPSSYPASYYYGVWLRHLVVAHNHGFCLPRKVAELGPGNSLGVGICALLSGTDNYYAFDVTFNRKARKRNIELFFEILRLFRERSPIPDEKEYPDLKPRLPNYDFPSNILTDEILENSLTFPRLEKVFQGLFNLSMNKKEDHFSYFVPWYEANLLEEESLDMVFSQAAMEHVSDLNMTYKLIYPWLKKGGFMSHQIDYKSHGTSDKWYGHWTYSETLWKIIEYPYLYLLNRKPHSYHVELQGKIGYNIVTEIPHIDNEVAMRSEFSSKFKENLTNDDLKTSSGFILSTK